MSLRKYQSVEKTEILSESEQDRINSTVKYLGKTSARELDEQERKLLDAQRVN